MTDLDDLRALAPRIPKARAAADAALPGYGTHSDGPGSGHGDRTVTLALKETMANDRAVHDLHRLSILAPNNSTARLERFHHAGCTITRQVSELHDIVTRWAPTERMVEGLRGETLGKGDDGCVSCAKVNDSLGRPLYSERHPGLKVCQRCHRDLKRVRARAKFEQAEVVPACVLRWRERHPAETRLTEDILDGLLSGRIVS